MRPDFAQSRRILEQAALDPRTGAEPHYLLWEICQACGDRDAALRHLDVAIGLNPLRSRPGAGRSVLALNTPGDFQANLPLPMLLDENTALHTLWLGGAIPTELPAFDCVFIAIAEDERHRDALVAADRLARELGRPVINNGARIASLSRTGVSDLLAGVPDAVVPRHTQRSRGELAMARTPFIVRPQSSHAGRELALIRAAVDLDAYLQRELPGDFTTAPFVDYRGWDGLFRKCRIVFVDGEPFPVHLAIHHEWAIWYYNANMADSDPKQAEEARFLADLPGYAGPVAMRALNAISQRVQLDYFGLDCAILPDGRLLVFEVETGMIVHDHDARPDQRSAARRIFRAVGSMLDKRIERPKAYRPRNDGFQRLAFDGIGPRSGPTG